MKYILKISALIAFWPFAWIISKYIKYLRSHPESEKTTKIQDFSAHWCQILAGKIKGKAATGTPVNSLKTRSFHTTSPDNRPEINQWYNLINTSFNHNL